MLNEKMKLNFEAWNTLRLKLEAAARDGSNTDDVWKSLYPNDEKLGVYAAAEVRSHLTCPGPDDRASAVFHYADFKGGAVNPLTWLYALRAHLRFTPHLHLEGKSLDEQDSHLSRALAKAPHAIGGLVVMIPVEVAEEAAPVQA